MTMKYSFVLLAYNQQNYIADAVSAALAQEGPGLEIILSDDCSTDRTFLIMRGLASAYRGPHRVVLNRNDTNIGVVAHIRKANALSTGDVLIAASGDDISLPDRACRIREAFEDKDAWLVHSHAICIDLEGNEIAPTYLSADLVKGADLLTVATSAGLYLGATAAFHRKLFDKYGYISNPRAYEDLVYGFRASLESGVRFIDHPLVKYRVGSGLSTSHLYQDVEGRQRSEIRRLKTQLAVLAQRRRDAERFGLTNSHAVMRTIRQYRRLTILGLLFWGEISGTVYRKIAWLHPLEAFAARKKVRRYRRAIAKAARRNQL
jgi:Glycosyl transferase family 2